MIIFIMTTLSVAQTLIIVDEIADTRAEAMTENRSNPTPH